MIPSGFLLRRGVKIELFDNQIHITKFKELGYKNEAEAIMDGWSRIRLHDHALCIQARTEHLCRKSAKLILDAYKIRINLVTMEWPGRYVELPPTEI